MEDPTNTQAEQTHTTEMPGAEIPAPDRQSDRDELKEASQQFFRMLLRAGVHLAMTPASLLPGEPREHLANAGSEFTRGLARLAHELADTLDKIVEEVNTDVKRTFDEQNNRKDTEIFTGCALISCFTLIALDDLCDVPRTPPSHSRA
jgi:hypothetical protein